jgi:GGDEF domain-containing protein
LCTEETSGLAIGVARFPENGQEAESLLAFAVQDLERAKEQRRASRGEVLRLEHSLQRPA